MASFTDELVAFNPYIPQIPVDDYVRVGLIKQSQYDQGVRKVQSYIDSISGIEAVKAEQQDYVKKRVGQLQGEISKIVGQDFSNQQLVTSVGNLTSKMSSDPIIQATEMSTRRYKQALGDMKRAQQEGKSSPSNEWYLQKQIGNWLGDGDVSTTFSGSYTPYTDVNKKVLDVIKELDPNSTLEDIPYKRLPGGQIEFEADGVTPKIDLAMMSKSVKGVTPERIEAAVRATLTPTELRQLQIDGMYNYKDLDKTGMKSVADGSYTYKLGQINDAIKGLMIDRQTNTSNPQHIAAVDAKIEDLKNMAEKYQQNYRRDIGKIDADLDGFKSSTYMDNWLSRFGSGFAYQEQSLTYKENPYFMAAERRRENDIRFQEFLVNKRFEAIRIGLEAERVAIDRERLGIERLKAEAELKKKGIGEDGAPLPLSGAAIRGPIDMAQLERINEASFMAETEQISSEIDNQKMAILAQVRPDLVKVVRAEDGTSPHYEYNVEGKDPNTVKSEAEATVLKFKEAYDKGEEVSDGVKTYFDNVSTADRRMQNRKSAIGNLQGEADKTWNIEPLLKNIPPLAVNTPNGFVMVTPKEQVEFNETFNSLVKSGAGGFPTLSDQEAAKVFQTPAQRAMYAAEKEARTSLAGARGENKRISDALYNVNQKVNRPNQTVMKNRNTYMNNAVRDIVGAAQPTSFTVEAFKGEDRMAAQAVAVNVVNDIVKEGKSNPNPLYDGDNASEMLNKTNSANTSYSLVSYGGDKYGLRLSNTSVTDDPVEIDITKVQAQDLFGANKFLDNFQAIREALQLSKGTGRVTTDVNDTGRQSAFSLKADQLKKYGVMYHVEDPLKNGGLQARLYIYDKGDKDNPGKWIERTANFGQLLTESQITRFLGMVNDTYIDNLLQKNK